MVSTLGSVRTRLRGAILILTFSLLSLTFAHGETTINNLVAPVYGAKTREVLIDQTASAKDFLDNEERSGIFPATTAIRNTGRLLIEAKSTGSRSSCSGIAINSQYFLTAAHCVCNLAGLHSQNFQECEATLDSLSLKIFFPTFGLVTLDGRPIVNPQYRAPTKIVEDTPETVADLAVLKLSKPIEVKALSIGDGSGKYEVLGAGLMYFTIPKVLTKLGLPPGISLHDGVFHMWRLQNVMSDPDSCGSMHSSDTFCSWYTPLPVLRGPLQSATVCTGDSGSPVIRRATTGNGFSVVGVTSYFSPRNDYDQCIADAAKRNHYVDLEYYKEWLQQFSTQKVENLPEKQCASALFREGAVDLIGFNGLLTVTSFKAKNEARPEITVKSNTLNCINDEFFGIHSCNIHNSTYTDVKIASGYAQLTICEEK